jgi:hypothetical protein
VSSSGQFIFGQPNNSANKRKGECRLPTVTELFPEIAAPGKKDDDQPSCSAAEALTRQEPFINQNLAYQALGMLAPTAAPRLGVVSRRIQQSGDRTACAAADSGGHDTCVT